MRRFGRRCGTVNIADLLLFIIILICISFRRFFLTKIRTFRSSSGLLHPSSQCLSYVHLFKCVMVFCYTKYSKIHVPFVKHFILRIYCLVITFFTFIQCAKQHITSGGYPQDITRTCYITWISGGRLADYCATFSTLEQRVSMECCNNIDECIH